VENVEHDRLMRYLQIRGEEPNIWFIQFISICVNISPYFSSSLFPTDYTISFYPWQDKTRNRDKNNTIGMESSAD